MNIQLKNLEDSAKLGRILARVMVECGLGLLVFYGGLGAGKTTLARHLVGELKGGGEAEVSSPSFTLCNSYATVPPVLHFDLYRLEDGPAEEFLEALDLLEEKGPAGLIVLVEWGERLKAEDLPAERLHCWLKELPDGRTAELLVYGKKAACLEETLPRLWFS